MPIELLSSANALFVHHPKEGVVSIRVMTSMDKDGLPVYNKVWVSAHEFLRSAEVMINTAINTIPDVTSIRRPDVTNNISRAVLERQTGICHDPSCRIEDDHLPHGKAT